MPIVKGRTSLPRCHCCSRVRGNDGLGMGLGTRRTRATTRVAPTGGPDGDDLTEQTTTDTAPEQAEPEIPTPSFEWMGRTLEWGVRVRPGKSGLTLGSLNVGVYGDIPDHWDDQTRMPRGAYPMPGVPPIGFGIRDKHELWADNAAELYEEAIQRRWAPATDVPWHTIEPLPDDVEAAMCQLSTELSQQANVEFETIGGWLHQMSYGYHEVKNFLATQMFDAARHCEVFRKRALANGGGMGLESKGDVNRMILESKGGWTETVLFLHLLRGDLTMTVYRYGEQFAHNEAERVLFARCVQDKARHVAYGLMHLRYALSHQPDKGLVFQRLLNIGERVLERELQDPAFRESLAIILGGGIEGARVGMERYARLMGDYVRQYLAHLEWLGVHRGEAFPAGLARYLEA